MENKEQQRWIYNEKEHKVVEQPTMQTPKWSDDVYEDLVDFKIRQEKYNSHIASMRSIPVSGAVDWKDGEDVTGKFTIKIAPLGDYIRTVAIPIKQEQEDEYCNAFTDFTDYSDDEPANQAAQPILQEQTLEKAALEYAIHHSSAPDKETPDWIISDFKAGAEWQKNHHKPILQDDVMDWRQLRKKFFEECTKKDSVDGVMVKIDVAPHDLFEWFKKRISDRITTLETANARLQKENEELKND